MLFPWQSFLSLPLINRGGLIKYSSVGPSYCPDTGAGVFISGARLPLCSKPQEMPVMSPPLLLNCLNCQGRRVC
jgi:hypothetical protein